jgi:magnesium chelatase subunit D
VTPPAGGPQSRASDARPRRRLPTPQQVRRQVENRERATVSRDQLAAAHDGFGEVSPALGRLDEGALRDELVRDEDAAVALLADLAVATDPQLRREARRLARGLLPPLGRAGEPRRAGTRRLVSRAELSAGELDLDRTLERSAGRRPRDPADLVVRRFAAAPRAVCLLVDRSGSMSGHAVALAAVAAAAIVGARSQRLRCSVVAFAAEPLVLLGDGSPRAAGAIVDDLLSLRGHGTTDLARALHAAADQLQAVPPGGRTALLMSDAQFTAGEDPLAAAARLDCLHVLGTSEEPDSITAATRLARRGGGRYLPAARLSQLAESLRFALAL